MERISRLFQEALAFLRALLGPVARSLRENAGLAVLSVVLAFGLWIFVTDTENPTRTGTLPFDLRVEPVNPSSDVALANELQMVRVRVEVADDVWDSLTPDDFKVTVNLEGLAPGNYSLPVRVEPLTRRGGLRVLGVIPGEIEVRLEPLFGKSVPVVVELEGSPPGDYEVGTARTETEAVLVTGPQERVNLVSRAVARLDLTGRTESISQAVRLEPRDDRGFLVEGVTLEPNFTEVFVPIQQTRYSRVLVVSPVVRGAPAEGYNVTDVRVEPVSVTVFGPREFIQQAVSIRTLPVDITNATDDVVKSVSLELPAGTSVSGGATVTVTVRVEPALGEVTLTLALRVRGLGEGLEIVGSLPEVEVVLGGELPTLQRLDPTDVQAVLDLFGLEAGTHRVPVDIVVPGGVTVAALSPQEVEVVLEGS